MRRALPFLFFRLAPLILPACSSGGSDGVPNGGSSGQAATGGVMPSGGGGALGTTGGSGGRSAGGQSSTGGAAATGGTGGSGGRGAGGRSAAGGVTATGGSAGTGVAGESAQGGVMANGGTSAGRGSGGAATGGSSATAGRGSAGAGNSGGAPTTGGAAGTAGSGGAVAYAQCPDATWKLAWGDDFDGAAGTAVDSSRWTYDSGPNWYNGELQYYSSGTGNASLDGDGNLIIEARKETREGKQYTSARLKTEGKKTFMYGRFEGRMKLPYGQGMWPAFWMLGGNSWPNTGEIDIMENLGREPSIVYGTIHGPGYSGSAGPGATYTLPGGVFSDGFHVFAIEWEANAIRWYVDGNLYSTKTPADVSGNTWVFDHGFFFLLNLAVGGDWPGAPDATTVFPQRFVIDYVRVCTK